MSEALYEFGGLRFWNEDEINLREMFQARAADVVKRSLVAVNPAWRFFRMEGPCLSPRDRVSTAYEDDDIFMTNHAAGGHFLALRAETTPSSYAYARTVTGKLPICVWQAGKSFRRETNDGASAAKLRFNEFWQQEFQCIYPQNTKADYRAWLMRKLVREVARFTGQEVRLVESDRLPSYSESTLDIEVLFQEKWREVASCSIRTDYSSETRVCEIAIGLCRIATMAAEFTREVTE